MASKVCEIAEKVVRPIVDDCGYTLVDIEFAKRVDGMNLEVTIDSPNGITLEDCEKVHREIDGPLDEANPTNDAPYILSVSSPGLDRPIKTQYDFLRNKGKKVEVKLYTKLDGKKSFEGELAEFSVDEVVITNQTGRLVFKRETVATILPIIEF